MLLTISTTHRPATDLGYLLYKNPARLQTFSLSYGQAHVFYPEATEVRCTAALLLDVNPVGLVRNLKNPSFALAQYVNDRPYVASSFLSVAIAEVFGSALAGRCKERPDLVGQPIPLEAHLAALPSRSGADLIAQLFEPLGYRVTVDSQPLNSAFPEWGTSPCYAVTLAATCPLSALLSHLYVLIPVLDDEKHYWVDDAEVQKLLRRGEGWLGEHPERELITRRYLKHQRSLADEALARLSEGEDAAAAPAGRSTDDEQALEAPLSLNQIRLGAVREALRCAGARRVLDLGCGEGQLIRALLEDAGFTEIGGMDVAHRELERAAARLERLAPAQRERVHLFQGSLVYRDNRLASYDAAAVVEVVEHLDPGRLAAFERVLWEFARPQTVVVTTPNREYNVRFPRLAAGALRHPDHRFEWTRGEFRAWASAVAARFGYGVAFEGIGADDREVGPPTQMAVFSRAGGVA